MSETEFLIPKKVPLSHQKDVDKGWAWVVLFGSSLCHLVFIGMSSGVGIFYVDIQTLLDVDIVDLSVIGALLNFSIYFGIAVTSPLTNVFGCRALAITGGLITSVSFLVCSVWISLYGLYLFLGITSGFGIALTYSSSVMVVNDYFNRRRPFGLIVILVVGGLGILSFSPFQSILLNNYPLKGVFLINAAFALQMVVGATLYFPKCHGTKADVKSETHGVLATYADKTLWRNPFFYMTFTSSFLVGIGTYIPFTLLPEYMVSQGIAMDTAALSVSASGATVTLGRMILSGISNTFPKSNRWIYTLSGLFSGFLLFIMPSCQSATDFLVVTAAYGLPYGVVSCLMPVLLVEMFGSDKLPACFGINNMAIGIASLIGSPFAGLLAAKLQLVGIEFIFAGLAFTSCGFVMIPTIIAETHCYKLTTFGSKGRREEKHILPEIVVQRHV